MTSARAPKYRRVLLKLSGENLAGTESMGIDPTILDDIALQIGQLHGIGVEIGMVIGGGNLFRGARLHEAGLNRVAGDHMGMLATIMNGIAIRDALERTNIRTTLMSAIAMNGIVEQYDQRRAIQSMGDGDVVVFTAGIGNPLFTTDTTACLRAIEVEADLVLKATQVDGIYSKDPLKYPDAEFYPQLDYDTIIEQGLQVMDLTAICLVRDYNMPLRVFNIARLENLRDIIMGSDIGTLVSREG